MATVQWRGDVQTSTTVITLTVGGGPATSAGSLGYTIGGKTVSATITGGMSAADFAAALALALQGSTVLEFQEYTWAYTPGDQVVTGTHNTPGVTGPSQGTGGAVSLPLLLSSTNYTVSAGLRLSVAVSQGTGPNDVNNAANWSTGSLPTNSDDIVVAKTSSSLLYNLDALSGVSPASVRIDASFTGAIGLPVRHPVGGGADYLEFRPRYWVLGGDPAVTIGEGDGTGSSRIFLSVGTGTCAVSVYGTAGRALPDCPAFNWINSGASNTLNVEAGDTGIAAEVGQTATVGTLTVAGGATADTGGGVTVGVGGTVTAATISGGAVDAYGTTGTVAMYGGYWTQFDGTLSSLTADRAGNIDLRITGTVGTLTLRGQGVGQPRCDVSRDQRSLTVSSLTVTGGAVLNDPGKRTAWSNAAWDMTSLANSNIGQRLTVTRT